MDTLDYFLPIVVWLTAINVWMIAFMFLVRLLKKIGGTK
jgi:hypothetical protein